MSGAMGCSWTAGRLQGQAGQVWGISGHRPGRAGRRDSGRERGRAWAWALGSLARPARLAGGCDGRPGPPQPGGCLRDPAAAVACGQASGHGHCTSREVADTQGRLHHELPAASSLLCAASAWGAGTGLPLRPDFQPLHPRQIPELHPSSVSRAGVGVGVHSLVCPGAQAARLTVDSGPQRLVPSSQRRAEGPRAPGNASSRESSWTAPPGEA